MTKHEPTLNFEHVEALRAVMLFTTVQMAKLLDVSRITYAGWVKGTSIIRKGNETKAKGKLREILQIKEGEKWPTDKIKAMTSKQRFTVFVALMVEPE